jgi:sterol desaturase/sphingolipid hydroxylase (fatty acid hydroxylase superfamily)
MSHYKIINDPEPVRLFRSDFLEFFTHIHPAVILVIWVPVAVAFLVLELIAALNAQASLWYLPAGFLLGLFIWSFAEYTLHRFLFHFRPRTPTQEKFFFLFHGVHHAQPQCKTRLVMPPVISIPMAVIFYFVFTLVIGSWIGAPHWVYPVLSGTAVGYIIYDMTHYATHHLPMRSGILKYLKRYHMQHHYKTPEQRYGVSSPLWDIIFRTKPS